MKTTRRTLLGTALVLILGVGAAEARADHPRHDEYGRVAAMAARVHQSAVAYERSICGCRTMRAEEVFAERAVRKAADLVGSLRGRPSWSRVWSDYAALNADLRAIERRVELLHRRNQLDRQVAISWRRLQADWNELDRLMEGCQRRGGWAHHNSSPPTFPGFGHPAIRGPYASR
jgi:hypothetical protein